MNALVSIITPVYNGEKYLDYCIQSVLNQTYQEFELILINDGSTDDSPSICSKYESLDSRIRVFNQSNQGVSTARNNALDSCKGKYITFLDCDDYFANDYLEHMVLLQNQTDGQVIIGGLDELRDENHIEKIPPVIGEFDNHLWNSIVENTEMFGYIGGKLYLTEIISKYNIRFNTKMYSQEDLDFNLSYYQYCDKFTLTEKAGYIYRYSQSNRKPAVFHYLANLEKLVKIAQEKTELTDKAVNAVISRMNLLIYCSLYDLETADACGKWVNELQDMKYLVKYIKDHPTTGLHAKISRLAIECKSRRIYLYFKLRKGISRMIRRKNNG